MHSVSVTYLSTIKQASIGLLRAKKAYPVYFRTRWGIHTFGMRFPIDILILNTKSVVVCIKKNLPPNRVFYWNPRYFDVLELPSGFIEKEAIVLGDTIMLTY